MPLWQTNIAQSRHNPHYTLHKLLRHNACFSGKEPCQLRGLCLPQGSTAPHLHSSQGLKSVRATDAGPISSPVALANHCRPTGCKCFPNRCRWVLLFLVGAQSTIRERSHKMLELPASSAFPQKEISDDLCDRSLVHVRSLSWLHIVKNPISA